MFFKERCLSICIFCIFVLISFGFSIQKTISSLIRYPSKDSDYAFRPLCDIGVIDNKLYCVENRLNKILVFSLDEKLSRMSLDKEIGRSGEGPGDLQFPLTISYYDNEILVREQGYFSIFGSNGEYISKFKTFSHRIDSTFYKGKIYWINQTLNENHLIEVYDKNGKRISCFGSKYTNKNIKKMKNTLLAEDVLNKGQLFIKNDIITYINKHNGEYIKYNINGETIKRGDLLNDFGERGFAIKNHFEECFNKGIEFTIPTKYPKATIFEDAYNTDKSIYFVNTVFKTASNSNMTVFNFYIFDLDSMNLLSKTSLERNNYCRLDSMAAIENNNRRIIVIAYTDLVEGHFVELIKYE